MLGNIELFKTKGFDYLWNGDYISTALKEEKRLRSIASHAASKGNPSLYFNPSSNAEGTIKDNSYTMTPGYGTANGILDENILSEGVQTYHDKNTGYIG